MSKLTHKELNTEDVLIRCYVIVGVAADQLPYSSDLDRIVNMYSQQAGDHLAPKVAFRWLINLQKDGDLPTLKPHNKLDELYVAAGRIPARFCKLWITKDAAIYKGQIEWYRPVKGEFVGTCDFATSAYHIAKEHNDALFEMWAKADAWVKRPITDEDINAVLNGTPLAGLPQTPSNERGS